jgi:hypothetical protein
MTPAQLATLAAHINASPDLSSFPNNSDGAFEIAALLNLDASPKFWVWKTSVAVQDIMANGFVWTAVDTLTVGKARIWDWMTRFGTINPSKANIRQGLSDAFGAASAMATAIMPHLKRGATRLEKLYTTGTGTEASPATLDVEGPIGYQEVMAARNP